MESQAPGTKRTTTERRRQQLRKALRNRGLRNTHQREILADVLFDSGRHLSVDELLAIARTQDKGIGYATAYRTVKLLSELGLVDERHFSDGQTRYEVSSSVHHDHLICTRCQTIVEFEDPQIEQLQEAVAAKNEFLLLNHRMELYGLCPKCRERAEPDESDSVDRNGHVGPLAS